jgi:hypothetical protein
VQNEWERAVFASAGAIDKASGSLARSNFTNDEDDDRLIGLESTLETGAGIEVDGKRANRVARMDWKKSYCE